MSTSPRSREEPSPQEQIGALVDERLLQLLSEAFPPHAAVPGTALDKLMYEAGIARVLSFLRECSTVARAL